MAHTVPFLSPELIIHPGETLEELLQDREMTQKELASRTGTSEKHVSQIINGRKNISNAFAKKLEYALGVNARFWVNLQSNYDQELIEYQEVNGISQEEIDILKPLKDILNYFKEISLVPNTSNKPELVLNLRRLLGVSDLAVIPSIESNVAYRAQVSDKIDPFVLFAWEKLCEVQTNAAKVERPLDLEVLKLRIPDMKSIMDEDPNEIIKKLTAIFDECGISFKVVRNFKGAPVQGFIKKTHDGKLLLGMTIRQHFADIFWFTLFHEIGHILNGDIKNKFIDFDNYESEVERKADYFARNTLIPDSLFEEFCSKKDLSEASIKDFSAECGVPSFILVGRLQKEGHLDWNMSRLKPRYVWANH